MAILIKRYANRKLYNTETSRYITLKGIATLLDLGDEVRVVDNETGEDITQVALSQILVDNKRANEDPSDTLLTQILSRGGDALYGAIRKSVDEATDGLGDFQDRFRQLVGQADSKTLGLGFPWEPRAARKDAESTASGSASSEGGQSGISKQELDRSVLAAVTRAVESLDLPRRRDIDALNQTFERVAAAIERLERAYLPRQKLDAAKDGSTKQTPSS